jgi:putative phosphotransacetylase
VERRGPVPGGRCPRRHAHAGRRPIRAHRGAFERDARRRRGSRHGSLHSVKGPSRPQLVRPRNAAAIEVGVGISNRHAHLSEADARTLFAGPLAVERAISQPGQFAAVQTVTITGPKGRIEGVRVVGPARGATQVELARSDARRLGIDPPVAASGSLEGSIGGVTLEGSAGRLPLEKGVIIAGRHLHLSESDARSWGLADGDLLDIRAGEGARAVTFHGVLVRAGPRYTTEIHLDVDEANAAGLRTGDRATIVAWKSRAGKRRRLITEREVIDLARRGDPIPPGSLLTPSALDRARALGLHLP